MSFIKVEIIRKGPTRLVTVDNKIVGELCEVEGYSAVQEFIKRLLELVEADNTEVVVKNA